MEVLQTLGIIPIQIGINIVAFGVLYWLLSKFLFRPIGNALEERAERVKADRDEAAKLRDDMRSQSAELEKRLANIETEARDRIQAAEHEARGLRETMLAEARGEREHVVAAGVAELRREREKLLVEIRDLIADLATAAAGRIIERELDVEAHRAMIDDIVEHGVR
jgi:F-type H+-transporting ATPase subunit b